jgi:phosphatidate cytidylyltransferase
MNSLFDAGGLILCLYFFLGALGIKRIGRRKSEEEQKALWTKYFVYLAIVICLFPLFTSNWVYGSLVVFFFLWAKAFQEVRAIWMLGRKAWYLFAFLFSLFLPVFFIASYFLDITGQVYLFVLVFDGFGQIAGQLFGRTRLFPQLSPGKTLEGYLGGFVFLLLTWTFLDSLSVGVSPWYQVLLIGFTAAMGDLLASWLKRKNQVKDFSSFIPGHGGVLDRFDSFFFSLASVVLLSLLMLIFTY